MIARQADQAVFAETARVAPQGHTYRLKFVEEQNRAAAEMEFEAMDAYQAFVIAHREGRKGSAELWRDGKKLCSFCEHAGSFWEIF